MTNMRDVHIPIVMQSLYRSRSSRMGARSTSAPASMCVLASDEEMSSDMVGAINALTALMLQCQTRWPTERDDATASESIHGDYTAVCGQTCASTHTNPPRVIVEFVVDDDEHCYFHKAEVKVSTGGTPTKTVYHRVLAELDASGSFEIKNPVHKYDTEQSTGANVPTLRMKRRNAWPSYTLLENLADAVHSPSVRQHRRARHSAHRIACTTVRSARSSANDDKDKDTTSAGVSSVPCGVEAGTALRVYI